MCFEQVLKASNSLPASQFVPIELLGVVEARPEGQPHPRRRRGQLGYVEAALRRRLHEPSQHRHRRVPRLCIAKLPFLITSTSPCGHYDDFPHSVAAQKNVSGLSTDSRSIARLCARERWRKKVCDQRDEGASSRDGVGQRPVFVSLAFNISLA